MAIVVDAVYENGVLRPTQPLPLKEHEKVEVTIRARPASPLSQAYGIIGWRGSHDELEPFVLSPELDPGEAE
jgi:predicted DNA-binding antitoxin AbrB/MazE fold protein